MKLRKANRLTDQYRDLVAQFIERNSNRKTLITITRVEMSKNGKKAMCHLSVFPPEQEQTGLDFAQRNTSRLRDFVATHSKTKSIPTFSFSLDMGEKNRQRIEKLLGTKC